MTAPTPEYETWMWAEMGRLQDALAVVTAERDQAIENARASQQIHEQARSLLDQVLTERDQDRQMLADAPHGAGCQYLNTKDGWHFGDCTCWKAGL